MNVTMVLLTLFTEYITYGLLRCINLRRANDILLPFISDKKLIYFLLWTAQCMIENISFKASYVRDFILSLKE